MKSTRQTQPYRKGARVPGPALTAMLRGRTTGGWNPIDSQRAMFLTGERRRPKRPQRPARPKR